MRRIIMFVLSIAVILGVATPAAAQDETYPPSDLVVSVSIDEIAIGETFEINIDGCQSGDNFEIDFVETTTTASCAVPRRKAGSLAGIGARGGSATATLTAPTTAGVYVGTVSFASVEAILASFEVTVLAAAPAEGLVADELVVKKLAGTVSGSLDLFTLLLLVFAGVAVTVVIRLRLLNE